MSEAGNRDVRVWEATSPCAVVVLAHGYGEAPDRYAYAAGRLSEAHFTVVSPDHHGNGRAERPRGRVGLRRAVADLDALVSSEIEGRPHLPVVLLGHSTGAGLALAYAIAHQDRLRALILAAPLVQLPQGRLRSMFGAAGATLLPDAPAMSFDPRVNSRDSRSIADYMADPLTRLGPISASTGAENARRDAALMPGIDTITLSTLLLWGTQEGLHPVGGAEPLLGALSHADLTRHPVDSLYQEIFSGPERAVAIEAAINWLAHDISLTPA